MSDEVIPSALLGTNPTPLPHPSSTYGRGSLVQTRPGLVLALIGLTGGLFGGLLGIGGGSAIAPLLLLLGVFRPSQIAGTTLATVLVISLVGSGAYASLGSLNLGLAWPIALGSVAGSILGARASKHLSIGLMTSIFLLILPYFALKEFWPSLAAPAIATNLGALVLLGLITGLFSGLLGIGGARLGSRRRYSWALRQHSLSGTAVYGRPGGDRRSVRRPAIRRSGGPDAEIYLRHFCSGHLGTHAGPHSGPAPTSTDQSTGHNPEPNVGFRPAESLRHGARDHTS